MTIGRALAAIAVLSALPVSAREISFEDRVRYQRAIEDVYWSHRIWPKENPTPKPPLSEVMTDDAIRARVTDDLKKSAALEAVWRRPVTGEQLQAELDRMVRETQSATTLNDLFRALGDDPFVIAETLARQTLVDRLAHDWYASDARFHGETKRRAEAARASCRTVADMRAMGGDYREVTLDSSEEDDRAFIERRLPDTGSRLGRISDIEETDAGFTVVGVLSEGGTQTRLAIVTWAKTPFDRWWSRERAELSATPGITAGPYKLETTNAATCTEDTWKSSGPVQYARARVWQAAVWTGSEMIVWSGRSSCSTCPPYVDGARYIPATDTWGEVPRYNVPTARLDHTAVWTGTEMIVWGGATSGTRHVAGDLTLPFPDVLNTGGRYNPTTQTWTPTSTGAGVPGPRQGHTAVWTGSVMVVWGGFFGGEQSTGGIYDPSSDSWTATSSVGAPSARYNHTAVWTGSQMIVWGGTGNPTIALNDGARFDPTSNAWTSMSIAGAPSARFEHSAVWDGNGMIVWGGDNSVSRTQTGGRYVPATDTWTATPLTAGVPSSRLRHTAVWTGTRMIVWGGQPSVSGFGVSTGSSYDPVTQVWTAVPTLSAPPARFAHSAVWTGTEMIVWGGSSSASPITAIETGGRYSPASGTWVPTRASSSGGPASPRYNQASVWTGTEMFIHGGFPDAYLVRYVPATSSWTFPPGGPFDGRVAPTAVWTGTEMIVWGGKVAVNSPALGIRYNPSTDTWTPTTDAGAPTVRTDHSAVWTGNVMVIWGGKNPSTQVATNTGGRYNPATNSWAATSLAFAPSARGSHRAVWTGKYTVLWGGTSGGGTGLDTGGRYDPVLDTWTSTSLGSGVPSPRYAHVSVWTGERMTVWGGGGAGVGSTGALYDPVADTWSAMSVANAPSERRSASATWTGTEMIAWGGLTATQAPLKTGGRYNPVIDTWAPTSTGANVPLARYAHAAEWTGRELVIWGGNDKVELEGNFIESGMSSGGHYCVNGCAQPQTFYRDADGDGFGNANLPALACALPVGFSAASTDCNDTNPSVNPGATEACNGVDLNCDGVGDTAIPSEIGFGAIVRLGPTSARYPWSTVSGTRYDAYRGVDAGAVGSDPLNETCLANDISTTFLDDASSPDPGTFSWFLVRAVNSCGDGTLGFQTANGAPTTERISPVCP